MSFFLLIQNKKNQDRDNDASESGCWHRKKNWEMQQEAEEKPNPVPPPVPKKREPLAVVEKKCAAIAGLKDYMMLNVWPLMAQLDKDTATTNLVSKLNEILQELPELASVFQEFGFVNQEFPEPVVWGKLSSELSRAETGFKDIIEELSKLKAKKARGRPFGSANKGRSGKDETGQTEGDEELELETPRCTRKRKTAAETAESSTKEPKKPKTQKASTADKAKGDQEESCDGEEPTKEPNKSIQIPLYTKCIIVEYAMKLAEDGTEASIEKAVMRKFKKYFFSVESERYKTGLLRKWTMNFGQRYIIRIQPRGSEIHPK